MCVLFVLTGDFEHNSLSIANGGMGFDPTTESFMANCPTIQLNLFQNNSLKFVIKLAVLCDSQAYVGQAC